MNLLLICTVIFFGPLVFLRHCKEAFSAPKNMLVFFVLAVLFLLTAFKYFSGKLKISFQPAILFLLFVILAFVSVFYSSNVMVSFRWALEMALYLGLFMAVVNAASGNINVYFGILNVALFSGFLVAVIGIFQFFRLDLVFKVSNFTGRISSTLGNANFLAGYLILLVPVSMALFFVVEKPVFKVVYAINTFVLLAALFFTQTLNAWIGLALGGLIFVILFVRYIPKYRKVVAVSALVLLTVVGALVFSFKPEEAIGKLNKFGQFETFAERGRWLMWRSAVEMIKERPLTGFGAGTFRLHFTGVEAKLLRTPEFEGYNHLITKDAHNDYLQIASELGIPGVLLLLTFIVTVVFGAARVLPKENIKMQIVNIGIICALIAFMVHMFFNFPFKLSPTASLFFVYLGLMASTHSIKETTGPYSQLRPVLFSVCLLVFLVAIPLESCIFWSNYKLGRGIEAGAAKQYGEALTQAQDSLIFSDIAGNTVDLRTHFYLGETNYHMRDFLSAENEFKKEVALNPFYPDASYNLALIQEMNGKEEEALSNFRRALSMDDKFEGVPEKIERLTKIVEKVNKVSKGDKESTKYKK